MNTVLEIPAATRLVRINHWRYARQLSVGEGKLFLEVTISSCSHCPTCQKRVNAFQQRLLEKPTECDWIFRKGSYWLVFPLPQGTDPLVFLREALDCFIEYC